MSTEDFVTESRRELGEKAAREGDVLHDNASPEFAEGYRRGSIGFGSNVTPKKFGKGREYQPEVWLCVCGHENNTNRRYMREGKVACWQCGTPREYGEEK